MKIKLIFILTLVVWTLTLCGQSKSKSFNDKTPLDLNTIKYIEIRNHSGKSDTVKTISKRLTTTQTKIFVEKFNNAKSSGLYKYITEYWVDVFLKNGTKRVFRVNSNHIKENNDYTFDLGDKKYLENLWQTIK